MYGLPGESATQYQARLGLLQADPRASERRRKELQDYLTQAAENQEFKGGIAGGFGAGQLPGYEKYMNTANATTELEDIRRVAAGREPLERNPVARSATPGSSFLAPATPAEPVRSSTGEDISSPRAEAQRGPTMPQQSENPALAGLRRAGLGGGTNRAFGQIPPSGLEDVTTATAQAGLGSELESAGFGAGSDLMRRAAARASGRDYFYGEQGPQAGGPPLGSAPTPTLRPGTKLSDESLTGYNERKVQQALDALKAQEPLFQAGLGRARAEAEIDPRVLAAQIGKESDIESARIQAERATRDYSQESALRALQAMAPSYDGAAATPAQRAIFESLARKAGVEVPSGGGGGASPNDPLGLRR